MKDIKTQVRSIEETLNSQFSFLCKHLGIPVPVIPSTNFTPDPGSTYAAKSSEETKSIDEAPTDSLELELIPNFFFIGNDDVDLLHSQFEDNSKLEINCFSELSPVTIDKIKDIEMQFWVNYLEKNSVISEYLMVYSFFIISYFIWILLVSILIIIASYSIECLQMVRMWRKVYFPLQLKYGSLHEIEVQILESLVVLRIHIKSLESFSEFIMFILHQGFLYLQLGVLPCVLLLD
ncbi:uncharacterized protein LOC113302210 isoform X4 [Papaver somniferum]|uniref:uncharacterized protein LOC113302210 isoform X4 n=1 Tax=Papaver somniferum TaxID=3469 RepID=UPI000E705AF5|nr:uncharacterized protein LOC113302210 isoform X4 [Papaver somniferum]